MKLIHKKNFFSSVCEIFTVLALSKIALEAAARGSFDGDQVNIVTIFLLSVLAVFVLALHYQFQKVPLPLVIALQYLFLLGAAFAMVWAGSLKEPLHENAYRDMFFSFTIPYIIGAVIYYVSFFRKVRRANKYLEEIRRQNVTGSR